MTWIKFLPYFVAVAIGFGLAVGVQRMAPAPVISVPACPACPTCPATVSLQNFDLDKLNNKKGTFTYSPSLKDVTVVIDCKDSVLIKQLLHRCN